MMKLEAVGLRGAAKLMPSELSGGMRGVQRWHVRLRWSPDLIMFDEPFCWARSHYHGRAGEADF